MVRPELQRDLITVSVVSHGHAAMLSMLLADIAEFPQIGRVIVTINVRESPVSVPASLSGRLTCRHNAAPLGFGANHNAAFADCQTPWFCVLNPDVRCSANPFPAMIAALNAHHAALCAPAVINPQGGVEDNVRKFPRPLSLLQKLLGRADGRIPYIVGDQPFAADWVAGMFMLFRSDMFRALGGFDEGYFLYYEDVDICVRAWKSGERVLVCPLASVMHDARRASHRNLRHLQWHTASMLRYFAKHLGRLPAIREQWQP